MPDNVILIWIAFRLISILIWPGTHKGAMFRERDGPTARCPKIEHRQKLCMQTCSSMLSPGRQWTLANWHKEAFSHLSCFSRIAFTKFASSKQISFFCQSIYSVPSWWPISINNTIINDNKKPFVVSWPIGKVNLKVAQGILGCSLLAISRQNWTTVNRENRRSRPFSVKSEFGVRDAKFRSIEVKWWKQIKNSSARSLDK